MCIRIVTTLFAVWVLFACSRTPDDQRIRADIETMRLAIQDRDPRAFLKHTATDFSGNDGTIDRDGLANVLRAEVLRNDSVGVTLGPIDVHIDGNRATVSLVATLTGGSGGFIPERGAIYSITSGWRRENKEWICYAAAWSQKL